MSEKAAVLAERYDKVMSQGKRNDIIRELEEMNGIVGTCGHDVHKSKSRDDLGEEYGLSGRSVSRLLRVNQLIPEMKNKLDAGERNLVTAVEMSYLSEDVQRAAVETGRAINKDMAVKFRKDNVTADSIGDIICQSNKVKKREKNIKIPAEVYEKYFQEIDARKATEIIQAALEAWFAGGGC